MNEEAKKIALEYLQKLLQGLEKGVDFAGEQIPLVLQEIVAYGRFYSTICIVAAVIVLIVGAFIYKKIWNYSEDLVDGDKYPIRIIGGFVFSIAVGIPFFGLICNNFDKFAKSWVAPRLYLIEYLHELVK